MAWMASIWPMMAKAGAVVGKVAPIAAKVAPVAVSVAQSKAAGERARDIAGMKARESVKQSKAAEAVAQRSALEERRKAGVMASRALALASASGGGALDPSVVNIIAGIDEYGEASAGTALYEGHTLSDRLKFQSEIYEHRGDQAVQAGRLKGLSTVMSGASSLYDKYRKR